METKLFEVRDSGTFIPAICIKLRPGNEADRYLLSRAGFGVHTEAQEEFILFASLEDDEMHYAYDNHSNRTRQVSHQYIRDHWDELISGEVIDVQYILGETTEKKLSEAFRNVN